MDKYKKGKNVEETMSLETLPLESLPKNVMWLRVRGGTKIQNVLEPALQHLRNGECVVWTGTGPAVQKAVSCAELCKNKLNHILHQVTRISWLCCDEHWEPLADELDELVVRRRLPAVHVLLSNTPIDSLQPGYQAPGHKTPFQTEIETSNIQKCIQ